jgi:hypothetical protein
MTRLLRHSVCLFLAAIYTAGILLACSGVLCPSPLDRGSQTRIDDIHDESGLAVRPLRTQTGLKLAPVLAGVIADGGLRGPIHAAFALPATDRSRLHQLLEVCLPADRAPPLV